MNFISVAFVGAMMLLPLIGFAAGGGGHGGAAAEGGESAANVTPTIAMPRDMPVYSAAESEILQELNVRKVELDRREQALELREKLADVLEGRLAARTTALEQLKADILKLMDGVSGKDDKDLSQLAQMYAAMKPTVAAGVLNKLDNNIVHDVLLRMPVKKSGKILEVMDVAKARKISEMMAARTMLPQVSAEAGVVAPSKPENVAQSPAEKK